MGFLPTAGQGAQSHQITPPTPQYLGHQLQAHPAASGAASTHPGQDELWSQLAREVSASRVGAELRSYGQRSAPVERCFVSAITHLSFSDPTTAYLDDSISWKKKKKMLQCSLLLM